MTGAQIIVLATPVFLLLIALEFAVGLARGRNTYRLADTLTSIGLGVISVPLFKADQQIVGALGAAFPAHFLQPNEEGPLIAALHDAARSISQRLGCAVYPVRTLPQSVRAPAAATRR